MQRGSRRRSRGQTPHQVNSNSRSGSRGSPQAQRDRSDTQFQRVRPSQVGTQAYGVQRRRIDLNRVRAFQHTPSTSARTGSVAHAACACSLETALPSHALQCTATHRSRSLSHCVATAARALSTTEDQSRLDRFAIDQCEASFQGRPHARRVHARPKNAHLHRRQARAHQVESRRKHALLQVLQASVEVRWK